MRFTILGIILLSGIGCKTCKHGLMPDASMTHSVITDTTMCKHDHVQCPTCKKEEKREKPAPPKETPAEPRKESIVTQDILLIPKMVYMPYAPQTPVAPARLGMTVPGREADPGPRAGPDPEKPRDDKSRDDKVCDALEKCCKKIESITERIYIIEQRTQGVPNQGTICEPRTPLLPRRRPPLINCDPAPTNCDPITIPDGITGSPNIQMQDPQTSFKPAK